LEISLGTSRSVVETLKSVRSPYLSSSICVCLCNQFLWSSSSSLHLS
jgi:hypothetical protein